MIGDTVAKRMARDIIQCNMRNKPCHSCKYGTPVIYDTDTGCNISLCEFATSTALSLLDMARNKILEGWEDGC